MLTRIFYSKTAAALATWLALGTAAFWILARLTPAWFGKLSWSQVVFIGFGFSLATLLVFGLTLALFAYAVRRIRPVPTSEITEELARVSERVKRTEERLDGARVAAAVGNAKSRSSAGYATLRFTDAERDRVSASLLKVKDYLEGEFRDGFAPIRQLLNWRKIMKLEGAAGLHEKVEAPRPTMRQFIDDFATAVKPYLDETNLLGIDVMSVKTTALPLWDAVRNVSNITGALQPEQHNPAPIELAAGEMSRVISQIQDEVDRVLNDIAEWRQKMAQGSLDE